MSLSFMDMVDALLKQKPELTAEKIQDLVEEKKRKVGAGYLTDQGALFLVAADLGISFENAPRSRSGLKDLYVGAKDVTVTGRIMNIYPVHNFTKRDSNEQSSTRTMVVFDKDAKVRVKLWDKQVNIPDEIGLQVGDLVKIIKGYVRAGLDGKPIINIGNYSVLEEVTQDEKNIPDIDSVTLTVDDVKDTQDSAVVAGFVNSNPRIIEFVNTRGDPSKSLQMQVSNEAGTRALRAVIWNVDESRVPKVFKTGARVRLIGVRVKQGNPQYGNGDFELHGDDGTILEFTGSQEDVDVMPLRIISVGEETGRGNFMCLAVDRAGRPLTLAVDNSLATSTLEPGTMVECVPSRIFGNQVTLAKEDSYIRVIDDDSSFPRTEKFETKIKNIVATDELAPIMVEAIVLQAPESNDVTTKSGESVSVSSTLLGDDTGEIRLVGWRTQSSQVARLSVGDRIRVIAATASLGREGRTELTLRPYSSITHLG